ncbi:MAG TPA: 50S ribosomal protein L6 [Candidatus Pacearchaeota archaeon]|nr:50S ribosomal protein L6 [Candidatus Parcubacteria bacterium]HOU45827.1 50S ribosomal protein L6 [Candidatus Pacearchaeota archaeon]HPM08522.1 50S ribosomal protein L6 [Candidatus Pacearchaeota archaeon]HQI74384.1 50S ribosomal protein L6 [Candidatus Pacearchaeota archaeon]
MSRIGKKPIQIPQGVDAKFENGKITIKGAKGELSLDIKKNISVEIKDGNIILDAKTDDKKQLGILKPYWGLYRALINNMVIGVTKGFEKKLVVQGIGFQANITGDELSLKVGFSHLVKIKKPKDINWEAKNNIITISGINKEEVGNLAAKIRKIKVPEPYQGKGIRYENEQVRRKLGKKATK